MATPTPRARAADPAAARRGTSADLGEDDVVVGEGVALDVPAASFGPRVIAGLVDLVLAVVVLAVAAVALLAAIGRSEPTVLISLILASVLAWVVWPMTWETLTRGRTVGKWMLGLRTVRTDGGPITAGHALVRALLAVVEIWSLQLVPALICSLVTRRGQRLGDLVAGTYVVRDRTGLQLPAPPAMPPQLARWAASADIAPLPRGLGVGIRQVLSRQETMSPPAWASLVDDLALRTSELVSPPPPAGTPPLAFLAAVAAERRRRDQRRLTREGELRTRLTERVRRA